ncbi:hypothetical protein ACTZWW_04220 [Salinarimonas sp. NSM]|uniref:hypothetical protein n=1 Tax=Salinarimonas sp. NSM TaxID=3458003 RepID=UPI0040364382
MGKVSAIYVIELFPGKVKIGQTRDWANRLAQYTHSGIIEPVQFELFPMDAIFLRDAERIVLERTARWAIIGEWRFCDFEDAAVVARAIHAEVEAGHFEMPVATRQTPPKRQTRRFEHGLANSRYRGEVGKIAPAYEVRRR